MYNYDLKSGKFYFYDKTKVPEITQISKMFKFEVKEKPKSNIFESSFVDSEFKPNVSNEKKKLSSEISEDSQTMSNMDIETKKKEMQFTFRNNNNPIVNEVTKQKLDQVIMKIEDYCCSNLFFQNLKEAEAEIQPEIKINELGSIDKFRWFVLYKDVKDEIQKLKEIEDKNKISILDTQMNNKRTKIMLNWSSKN